MRNDCSLWQEVAAEALAERLVERLLAGMAERCVAGVVTEPDRLDEILVQPERARDDARDRGRLERVGHPRPVVVTLRVDEDLCLPLQRRNGFEWTSRSRSRWNGVRTEHGSSSRSRPRVSYERTASGDSVTSSSARSRSANVSAMRPATSMAPG